MSFLVCLASDWPLTPDEASDIWLIGAADDLQSKKTYLAAVDWEDCTPAGAEMLLDYIRRHMEGAEELELWHSWMGSNEEHYPPLVKREEIDFSALTPEKIGDLCKTDVLMSYFDNVDVARQYCLVIRKQKEGQRI